MQKKVTMTLVTLLVLMTLLFAACAPATEEPAPAEVEEVEPTEAPTEEVVEEPTEEPQPEPVIITDALGNTVELPALPQRVVVCGKATPFTLATTYLFAEASEQVVAQELRGLTTPDFLSLIDPKYDEKTVLEMESGPEQIAPSNPDLAIMKNWAVGKLGAALQEIDIPVIGLDLETPEKFYMDMDALGQAFGNPERAAEIKEYYQTRISAIEENTATLADEDKPTVLVLQYSESDGEIAFKVPPASYLQTMIVSGSGGVPVWAEGTEEESGWIVVNFEQIAAWDPDMIFVINYKGSSVETVDTLKEDAKWQELKAVKNDQVWGFAADYQSWELPAPTWLLGYMWIATKIQPELNADIDIMAEVSSFYQTMYRLDDAQIEESILSRLVAP